MNCLTQSCGRNVSNAEVSSAYIDCLTMCQKDPTSLTAILRDASCDQVRGKGTQRGWMRDVVVRRRV